MFNPSYLTLSRHNLYYFRFPIPANLHPDRKRTEIRVSLNTRSPQEALHLAHYLTYYGLRWFEVQVFTNMEYKSIRIAITNYFRELLAQLSEQVAKNGPLRSIIVSFSLVSACAGIGAL